MRELVGKNEGNLGMDLDSTETETGSVTSSPSQKQLQRAASNMSVQAADGQAGRPQTLAAVSVSLGEIAIFVSGQTCKQWWPEQVGSQLATKHPVRLHG